MTVKDKLARAFAAVFPTLREEDIVTLRRDDNELWDSLAGLTLMTVVQQEFGITPDLFVWGDLASFEDVLAYVESLNV